MIKLPDFEPFKPVSNELINKYGDIVAPQMLEFWKTYGLGSFKEGFMKAIDPDDWYDVLQKTSVEEAESIPLFVTGMGDLLVWNWKDNALIVFTIPRGKFDVVEVTMKYFFGDVVDDPEEDLMNEMFEWETYQKAIHQYGNIKYDECFGHVPLLAIGGSDDVESLRILKMKEHMLMNAMIIGNVL